MTRFLMILILLFSPESYAALEILVTPIKPDAHSLRQWTEAVLRDTRLKKELGTSIYRILSSELLESEGMFSASDSKTTSSNVPKLRLQIFDFTRDRLLSVITSGKNLEIIPQVVFGTEDQPLPTHEDFLLGAEILREDPLIGPEIKSGRLVPYEAMPLLLPPRDGGGKRVISIGLRPISDSSRHEIVGVDLSQRAVERFSRMAPPTALATRHTCGPPSANQPITRIGTPGSVKIRVRRDGEVLWQMTAIRPSASSGRWGSGIELVNVSYKGKSVLRRAHAPILNVDYVNDTCGPYRDPVNNENAFQVEGTRINSGFIRTPSIPKTIFETKVDRGNYRGVAVYEDSDRLILVSELSATWYRYVSEFRFHADGKIEPIFKFDAVHNSCTCLAHHHHVYWRFDFDIESSSPNSMQAARDGIWQPIETESKFIRAQGTSAWRVINDRTQRGYEITPGPYDSSTNTFGSGDAWVLRYRRGEVDDSRLGSSKHAKIDSWLTGESTSGADVVFWYAGHIFHDQNGEETPHVTGPTFQPIGP